MFEGNSQASLYRLRDLDRAFQPQQGEYRPTAPKRANFGMLLSVPVVLLTALTAGGMWLVM